MSKHKTAPVPYSAADWSIARRKGNRVRYQNRVTAAMTGWCASPEYLAEQAKPKREVRIAGKRAGKTAALQAEVRAYWRQTDAALRVDRLTVPELRTNLRTAGIEYTTRHRKAELVALLLGTELA